MALQPQPADWSESVRARFPYLRERVYLDTAAAGLTWDGHGGAVAANGDVYYAQLNGTMRKFVRQ